MGHSLTLTLLGKIGKVRLRDKPGKIAVPLALTIDFDVFSEPEV
jgi:hypothetical protein